MVRQFLEKVCLESGLSVGPGLFSLPDLPQAARAELLLFHVDAIDGETCPALAALRARSDVKIVAIHSLIEDLSMLSEIARVADAVLPESDVDVMLAPTLRIVGAGYRVSPAGVEIAEPQTVAGVPDGTGSPANAEAAKALGLLSGQEIAVLERLPYGWSNKQIGRDLHIAEATVKVHLRAIFRKLDVANRTAAAIWSANHLGGGVALPPAAPPRRGASGLPASSSARVLARLVPTDLARP